MTKRHWTKSYRGCPVDIDPDRYSSLVELLEHAMVTYRDNDAVCCLGKTLTYADIDRLSAAFCAYLQTNVGIRKGDHIAVMMPNLAAFTIAFLGIIRAGAVQVNVNPMYTPRELEHQLNDSGATAIVVVNESTPTLAEVLARTGVSTVITADLGDGLGMPNLSEPVDPRILGSTTFSQALELGSGLRRHAVTVTGDDLLFLQYTGGTTGPSKGAALSHRNVVANTEQFKALMGGILNPGKECIVTAIPLYHIYALMVNLISFFSIGATNWLVIDPRDINTLVGVLKEARPTIFTGVNTLFAGLTMHPELKDVDWSRLRLASGGGAAILPTTSKRWEEITGKFIREGYGLSETSPLVSFNPPFVDEFNGTTGLPVPSTDVKLLDDNDREVDIGESGEVCVRGPQVMTGYWRQPEATEAAFTNDGYFRTGDVGVFDSHGFLKLVDRKKDMIIVSGFNVFPNDVEAEAARCVGIAECACIGVPDERSGEAVMLFAVRTPDTNLTEADVVAHCRSVLAGYKVPKIVRFVDELPKSLVGKVLRRELRDLV